MDQATPSDAVPRGFCDFAAWVGIGLTPAQQALCKVAYDGYDPKDLEGTERELARQIFGDVDVVPPDCRRVLVAVCGARAGKTMVLVATRLLHLALTVPIDTLGPGEWGTALIVAPDLRLSRQALRYVKGIIEKTPTLSAMLHKGDRGGTGVTDGLLLDRENGRQVSIECLPATRGGSAVRGRSYVGAAMDEAAFFRDDNSVVNDGEIFRSIMARLNLPGSQCIVASTAWEESGLLYEKFKENFGHPRGELAAHAPTTVMRCDPDVEYMVEKERRRDPDNAEREFDAVFMSGSGSAFLPVAAIDAAVDTGRTGAMPHYTAAQVEVSADFAFRQDSSALCVGQRLGEVVHVSDPIERRPEREKPLKPSEVIKEFAEHAKTFKATTIMADSHYIEAVREGLEPYGISVIRAPEGQDGKNKTYIVLREALIEGRVRLPDNPRLIAQLKAVTSRPTPGGGMNIQSPRVMGGGHGDLVSALVLCVWKCIGKRRREEEFHCVASAWAPPEYDVRPKLLGTPDHSTDTK